MSLSECVAAARAAGMTYGQYMTLHRAEPKAKEPEGNGRYCHICGKSLQNRQRKYCTECRDKYVYF